MADIELVIKIPESYYKIITNKVKTARDDGVYLGWTAIANGTPLPKGHGRLIDISPYEQWFNPVIQYDDGDHIHQVYAKIVPTIIEADKGESE